MEVFPTNPCDGSLSHDENRFQQDDGTSIQRMHDHIRVFRVRVHREKDPSIPWSWYDHHGLRIEGLKSLEREKGMKGKE